MLPEHRVQIVQHNEESEMDKYMAKHKAKRPTRDEFELEELGNQLTEAKNEEMLVSLSVWGESDPVVGRIVDLVARTRVVHVERHGAVTKVPFLDIMKVNSAQ
nr:YolD-like family protein [Paenibacillus hemerocallicola]